MKKYFQNPKVFFNTLALLIPLLFSGGAAAQSFTPGACSLVPNSKSCIDSAPCKQSSTGEMVCLSGVPLPAGAISTPQSCWQYAYQYACSSASANSCAAYENNAACAVIASACTDTIAESGNCSAWKNTFQCQTQAEKSEKKLVCESGLFNMQAMPTPEKKNNNFATAAVAQEIIRQGQVYGKNGTNMFAGVRETCTTGYFGIKNCCNSTPGAKSNSAVMSTAVSTGLGGAKYVGEKMIDAASPYVFDAMYSSGVFSQGLESFLWTNTSAYVDGTGLVAGTNAAAAGFTMGAYGFTYGTGAFETFAASSWLPGTMNLGPSLGMSSAEGFLAFNPYVFAAMVAIQIITSLAECSQDEQMLALHRGASLSVFISKKCTSEIPIIGTCIEWTSSYCSFNSVLAKIVNTQGKPQLGQSIASCEGLTPAQLSQLDFTQIDFSEFSQKMVSQGTNNQPMNISQNYTPIMNSATKGSAQKNSSLLPTYPKKP
jgi:conjugal transfer mating pair stabilization protein TraN